MTSAIGLMAFNEAANIGPALQSILAQEGPHVAIGTVTVVASGCTDGTVEQAASASGGDPRVRILEQPVREGKASAITVFLRAVNGAEVVVLAGADTRLEPGCLEALLAPFDDRSVGMTGGRPVPVNDPRGLMGRVVHLLWALHHEVALRDPKLGELIAFRPVLPALPPDTAVDEAAIESLVRAKGLRLVYAPGAIVRMRGPATVADYLAQRRRIHAGHLILRRRAGYAVSTLSARRVLSAAWRARRRPVVDPRALVRDEARGEADESALGTHRTSASIPTSQKPSVGVSVEDPDARAGASRDLLTLGAAAALEATARLLGSWDARIARRDHRAWKPIPSTKDLTP